MGRKCCKAHHAKWKKNPAIPGGSNRCVTKRVRYLFVHINFLITNNLSTRGSTVGFLDIRIVV